MRIITINEAAELLSEHDCFHILTHRYPDGDTLGCGFALCYALRDMGKKANVVTCSGVPSKFKYVAQSYEEQDFIPQYIVSVDVAASSLLGVLEEEYKDKIDLCIDHHGSNSLKADNSCIDSTAAAASEIVYDIIKLMGATVSRDIANCIYTGISTDTGCFMYTNTTSKTHLIAAQLIETGCDWQMINRVNFETKSKSKINMERMVYDTMEYYSGGKCAIAYTTLGMQQALCAGDDEMEGLASLPRQIDGVKMGILMREKEDGTFKVSVRTNDGVDASRFCAKFNGGGHPGAAGCSIKGDLGTVKAMLISAAEELL